MYLIVVTVDVNMYLIVVTVDVNMYLIVVTVDVNMYLIVVTVDVNMYLIVITVDVNMYLIVVTVAKVCPLIHFVKTKLYIMHSLPRLVLAYIFDAAVDCSREFFRKHCCILSI